MPENNSVIEVTSLIDQPFTSLIDQPFDAETKTKLRGFSPRANHTDRAAAAGRRS